MLRRHVIGLAVGPTLDEIATALLEVQGEGLNLQATTRHWHLEPLHRDLRSLLVETSTPQRADVRQISLAHRVLGETLAGAARRLADQASISLQAILATGCLGHTAWHDGGGRLASTLSLGASAYIAERTGLTTISDFSGRDLACGGQGSPLATLVDYLLARDPDESRLVIHLGGLARLTYLPAGATIHAIQGWECGPCNVLLNCLMERVSEGRERADTGGRFAVQGRQIAELLRRWLNHPLLLNKWPKSTHRSSFAEEFALQTVNLAREHGWSGRDLLCTANHFVARLIGESIRRTLPHRAALDRVLLTGSGVRNGLLWRLLEEQLGGPPIQTSESAGQPPDADEAVDAAILACLTLDGVPANVPAATGAAGARLLGTITPGSMPNWNRALSWLTGQREEVDDLDE